MVRLRGEVRKASRTHTVKGLECHFKSFGLMYRAGGATETRAEECMVKIAH